MKTFTKKTENFVCENCGVENIGNGYTNHCANCLWSKHVDVNPGDRAEQCGGLMKPIEIIQIKQEFSVLQECQKCGHQRKNKISKEDNFDVVLKIIKDKASR